MKTEEVTIPIKVDIEETEQKLEHIKILLEEIKVSFQEVKDLFKHFL